jgi:hypothetical protein
MATLLLHDTQVTFGTSGFSAELKSMDIGEFTRAVVDASSFNQDLSSDNGKIFRVSKMVDYGSFSGTLLYDNAVTNPVGGAVGDATDAITVTWEDDSTSTFSAFWQSFTITGSEDEMVTANFSMKITGKVS